MIEQTKEVMLSRVTNTKKIEGDDVSVRKLQSVVEVSGNRKGD